MKRKVFVIVLVLFGFCFISAAQNNFTFSPVKPHPGNKIVFHYTASSGIFNDSDTIHCVAYLMVEDGSSAAMTIGAPFKHQEISLAREGNQYTGSVQTEEMTRAIAFSFTSGKIKTQRVGGKLVLAEGKADDNNKLGYCFPLYTAEGKVCRYANFFLGNYFSLSYYNGIGLINEDRGLEYYQKEMSLFPDAKYYTFMWLAMNLSGRDYEKFKAIANEESEKLFADSLKKNEDVSLLASISYYLKLKKQSAYYNNLYNKLTGDSSVVQVMRHNFDKIDTIPDFTKKEEILKNQFTLYNKLSYPERTNLAYDATNPDAMRQYLLQKYVFAGKYDDYKTKAEQFGITVEKEPYNYWFFLTVVDSLSAQPPYKEIADKLRLQYYNFYKSLAQKLQKDEAIPVTELDDYYTKAEKLDITNTALTYFTYTYASACLKKEEYKKGFEFAEEAVQYMNSLKDEFYYAPDVNTTYCLLTEKALPLSESINVTEKAIASGKWKPEMIDLLKRLYIKKNKSEKGFDDYLASIKKAQLDDLKKNLLAEQLNEPAPSFELKNMDGNTVKLSDLKGKIVVLDFWATWCGPCQASFPGMQKLVTANKDNDETVFLFVDTWENRGGDKTPEEIRTAAAYLMKSKNYDFKILLDVKNEVVENFKVSGIPTKFIIDKKGNIRYKILGAETNEGKLFDEMNTMIGSVK